MADALSASTLRGRRILMVEDEYMMADDLRHDLELAGTQVVGSVPSVADALELLAQVAPSTEPSST
jgi:AmiR/NasT family two-component response regulator